MFIDLNNLFLRRNAVSRSISAENPDGKPGGGGRATAETTLHPASANHARGLGQGWKLSPCIAIGPGETATLMDTEGPGCIRHIWVTLNERFYRSAVIRVYWDGQTHPSVEAPIGDFFCNSWGAHQDIVSQPVSVNPTGGMNFYFPMPFREHSRITVENQSGEEMPNLFYQIDYTLEPVHQEALFLHATWRRTNPIPVKENHILLDQVEGQGQFVGTFVSWEQRSKGWWGEGEIKIWLDDDDEYPTICGTGIEDYFGGAWCFGDNFSAPYLGYRKVSGDDVGSRMIMYRFHVLDPIFFSRRIRIELQAIGWQSDGRYLPLEDDVASVAYWYQTLPSSPLRPLQNVTERSIDIPS